MAARKSTNPKPPSAPKAPKPPAPPKAKPQPKPESAPQETPKPLPINENGKVTVQLISPLSYLTTIDGKQASVDRFEPFEVELEEAQRLIEIDNGERFAVVEPPAQTEAVDPVTEVNEEESDADNQGGEVTNEGEGGHEQ